MSMRMGVIYGLEVIGLYILQKVRVVLVTLFKEQFAVWMEFCLETLVLNF